MQGILNEIGIEQRTDRNNRNYISGRVSLLVDQAVYGDVEHNEIAVSVFAYEMTNSGKPNPSYKSLSDLIENGMSVAATGSPELADKYRVTGCDLRTNEFDSRDGRHVVYPEVRGSFFSKVTGAFAPIATFEEEIYILGITPEEKNDEPTGRLVVKGATVGWGDKINVIDYIVESPQAVQYVEQNWGPEMTVTINGKIRSTVTTETRTVNSESMGFGEAPVRTFNRTLKEYVITAGSAPMEEGYDPTEIQDAIARQNSLVKSTPTPVAAPSPRDRGF